MNRLFAQLINYVRHFLLLKQIIKFSLVGGSAAALNFVIYFSLTHFFDVWYVYSAVVAYSVSAVWNFIANKLWTFRNTEVGVHAMQQVGKFSLVMASGLFINTGIIYVLTDHYGSDYRISWLVATFLVAGWNFACNRWWTFRRTPSIVELS